MKDNDNAPVSFYDTRTTGCGVLLEPKNWRKPPNSAESLAELLVEARLHPRLWYLCLVHRIYPYMMYYYTRNLHRLWYPIGIFWEETSWRRPILSFCYLGPRVTFFDILLLGTSRHIALRWHELWSSTYFKLQYRQKWRRGRPKTNMRAPMTTRLPFPDMLNAIMMTMVATIRNTFASITWMERRGRRAIQVVDTDVSSIGIDSIDTISTFDDWHVCGWMIMIMLQYSSTVLKQQGVECS